ncbi:MAG TPA: hypothetical protein VGX23_13785 [Actinocrinis sp.]|nr:hypothetical protein [Actinocrinis sp.]
MAGFYSAAAIDQAQGEDRAGVLSLAPPVLVVPVPEEALAVLCVEPGRTTATASAPAAPEIRTRK